MKLPAYLRRVLPWLNFPAAMLVMLLQRAPAIRAVTAATNYALASTMGQVLRASFTAAALGAVHSLAGATTFVISAANPIRGTVGQPITPVSFTYNGTPTNPASFQFSGTLPPGLTFSPVPLGSTIRSGTPVISGTPTQAGTFTVFVQGFNPDGLTNNIQQPITFAIEGTTAAPAIVTPPQSRSVPAGSSVTFSVTATGSPVPTYQWRKDNVNIGGATSATLTLPSVQPADGGAYSVLVTNSAGSVASAAAVLTVTSGGGGGVAFTTQPSSQTVAGGSTVVFQAVAGGATQFQWRKNGTTLAGATTRMLVLSNVSAAQAGEYSVEASGGGTTVSSNPAMLTVTAAEPAAVGRLINLSVLTAAGAGADALTVGTVIGPLGSAQSLPVVVRAVGPTLGTTFGLEGVLGDPTMTVNRAGVAAPLGANDNWGGSSVLADAFASVGGFALPTASLDSAIVAAAPGLTAGGYTVQVTGNGALSGLVLAELYDASGSVRTSASPRLINVSVLKQIDTGATLTVGFVLGGQTARTVLVRAVGPTLGEAPFGLDATMPDPQLALFSTAKIAENDDWGGDPQLASAAASVGAFALAGNASRDAMLLVTLPPGNYTAQVTGAGAGGVALVEVYEVP